MKLKTTAVLTLALAAPAMAQNSIQKQMVCDTIRNDVRGIADLRDHGFSQDKVTSVEIESSDHVLLDSTIAAEVNFVFSNPTMPSDDLEAAAREHCMEAN
jgi:hypothetical protein